VNIKDDDGGCMFGICCFVLGVLIGIGIYKSWGSHEQGVRDALAGKYVVVQLPDGTSVVVENKEARP
jgi:hypothetical protein